MTTAATKPENASNPLTVVASTLGAVSIAMALFFSGYAAIALGLVAFAGGVYVRRGAPVVLGLFGLVLGLSAQLMKMAVMSR